METLDVARQPGTATFDGPIYFILVNKGLWKVTHYVPKPCLKEIC
jgi:hypothetical protein